MCQHRRGLEPKTERAERAGLKVRKPNLPAEYPREKPRRAGLLEEMGSYCGP
jgi:hypothetical protein